MYIIMCLRVNFSIRIILSRILLMVIRLTDSVLSSAFETESVEYGKERSKKMYGLTTIDVRRLAYAVAAKLEIHTERVW